jgi:hypothetical protein
MDDAIWTYIVVGLVVFLTFGVCLIIDIYIENNDLNDVNAWCRQCGYDRGEKVGFDYWCVNGFPTTTNFSNFHRYYEFKRVMEGGACR